MIFFLLLLSSLAASSPGLIDAIYKYKEAKAIFISTDSFPESRPIKAALEAGFETIHGIDLHVREHLASIARFGNVPNISLYTHDSPPLLIAILARVKEPALIWLNGIRRDDLTIGGKRVHENSPLLRELAAIRTSSIHNHTLLIGDFERFPLEELYFAIRQINPNYEFFFEDEGQILGARVQK